jgi:beta-lactam-binding protein with PASTA domain
MSEGKKGYHPFLIYTVAIAGIFILGMAVFNLVILPVLTGRGDIVIVPELEGIPLEAAEEACRESGLNLMVTGERFSDSSPAGYVLEQDPSPGEGLKGRRTVKVVTSSGMQMEEVPDLEGRSLREAELDLEGARLRRGSIARVFTADEGPNRIAASSPQGGSLAPAGSQVDLLLYMTGEPSVFLMPDLTGKDLLFVRERLERGGFHVTRVVSRRDGSRFPGTILSQNPPAGYSIKEGGTIELVVSTVD